MKKFTELFANGIRAAGLVCFAFVISACTQTPTAEEMKPYSTVFVQPIGGVTPDIVSRLPAGFSEAVVDELKKTFAGKGYGIAPDRGSADLRLVAIFRAGSRPNPINTHGHPAQTPAFPRTIDTGSLDFCLRNKDGLRIFQTTTGHEMPVESLTRFYIAGAVTDAFADLPAKNAPEEKPAAR